MIYAQECNICIIVTLLLVFWGSSILISTVSTYSEQVFPFSYVSQHLYLFISSIIVIFIRVEWYTNVVLTYISLMPGILNICKSIGYPFVLCLNFSFFSFTDHFKWGLFLSCCLSILHILDRCRDGKIFSHSALLTLQWLSFPCIIWSL